MVWTGVDGDKVFSLEVPRFRKEWRPTSKIGKKIYVVPSHLCLVRRGSTDIRDPKDIRRSVALEVEEKFGDVLWDLKPVEGGYILAVVRGFSPPEDAYALDPEVFSLARCARAMDLGDCTVVDIKRERTTVVRVRGGRMESYRVLMRGSNHFNNRPEKLREIFEDLGWDLSKEDVVLGGVVTTDVVKDLFGRVHRNRFADPGMNAAFGAAMRYVIPDEAPDFREEEISARDLKIYFALNGLALVAFVAAILGSEIFKDTAIKELRSKQRDIFREMFPQLPAVGILDQVRAMASGDKISLTGKLVEIAPYLRRGMRIYSIEFNGVELRLRGEVSNLDLVEDLKPEMVRKTPEETYEFEVVVR